MTRISMQFSRLWEAIAPQPQAASTKDAYLRVQHNEIFRLVPNSVQNFGVHFHRTFLALAFQTLKIFNYQYQFF